VAKFKKKQRFNDSKVKKYKIRAPESINEIYNTREAGL
jgi:hypothetical protein